MKITVVAEYPGDSHSTLELESGEREIDIPEILYDRTSRALYIRRHGLWIEVQVEDFVDAVDRALEEKAHGRK